MPFKGIGVGSGGQSTYCGPVTDDETPDTPADDTPEASSDNAQDTSADDTSEASSDSTQDMPEQDAAGASADEESIPPHSNEDEQPRRRSLIPILAAALVIILAVGAFLWFGRNGDTPAVAPTPTATATAPSPNGSAQPSTTPDPDACTPFKQQFVPTKLTIPELGVESPIIALGRDESDAAAAPPKDQPNTTGWFDEGPKAASSQGKVLLTIHTYRNGGALGNQLLDEWKPGMTLKLSDGAGNVACYTTGEELKFNVADYDPESKVLYDWDSPEPQVAIIVCDDFNQQKQDWDARVIFYADEAVQGGPTGSSGPQPSGEPQAPSAAPKG